LASYEKWLRLKENVTLGEKRFLKEHSMDLVRLIPLV
jgi:hypothetical protein